ncbi:MAG: LysM domain-containing protein [Parasulfuritortus sp.]|jgi:hypothetical protein|nr:LysM domain-containing protein [Parasulfuritortus sp.]
MKRSLNRLVPLVPGMIMLAGCAGAPNTQTTEAAKAQPVASTPAAAAPAATPAPVVAAKAPEQAAAPAKVDHYTVVKGDTLSKIAAKSEVYGDKTLWPLLYQSNFAQIKPGGLIFPGQVLTVGRTYSEAEIKALKAKGHAHAQPMLHVVPSKPVAKAAVSTAATPAKATAAVTEAKTAAGAAEAKSKTGAAEVKPEEKAAAVAPAQAQPAEPAQAVAPVVKPRPEVAPGAATLEAARRAFEAGDIEWTLHYYNAYLDGHQNDANAWGELGNVYNSQGMMQESAQSYYNAANLLIDQGKTARALDLIPAIQAGSPELADSIYWRLTSVNQ